MAKRRISVHTAFNLNLKGNDQGESLRQMTFKPGTYEVDDEVADHWYVQHHIEGGDTSRSQKAEPAVKKIVPQRVDAVPVDENEAEDQGAEDDQQDNRPLSRKERLALKKAQGK